MLIFLLFIGLSTINLVLADPKVSIITSLYNSEMFINQFIQEIRKQTVFSSCELILMNANSPGKEENIIFKWIKPTSIKFVKMEFSERDLSNILRTIHQKYKNLDQINLILKTNKSIIKYIKHHNIIYIRLPYDPGLYGTWNLAIKLSQGKYITNANVDDRLCHTCYEKYIEVLENDQKIDLVYSDLYQTHIPNLTPETINKENSTYDCIPEFNHKILNYSNAPNDHPMWRKSCHNRFGYFNERFLIAGDFEMWVRMVVHGAQFKKVPEIYGIHYINPCGLSTNPKSNSLVLKEIKKVVELYQPYLNSINVNF